MWTARWTARSADSRMADYYGPCILLNEPEEKGTEEWQQRFERDRWESGGCATKHARDVTLKSCAMCTSLSFARAAWAAWAARRAGRTEQVTAADWQLARCMLVGLALPGAVLDLFDDLGRLGSVFGSRDRRCKLVQRPYSGTMDGIPRKEKVEAASVVDSCFGKYVLQRTKAGP